MTTTIQIYFCIANPIGATLHCLTPTRYYGQTGGRWDRSQPRNVAPAGKRPLHAAYFKQKKGISVHPNKSSFKTDHDL